MELYQGMGASSGAMMESHIVLNRLFPPSTQEISTLDLGKTGTGGRHSVKPSISMPIPETALQVDQQLPPSITEMRHKSDHDFEKSGTSDSEKASISMPVWETETLDIEHVPVQNDPRKWSSFRKVSLLTQVSLSSFLLSTFLHSMLPWH